MSDQIGICTRCKDPIKKGGLPYVSVDEGLFHSKCFGDGTAPFCEVCHKPQIGPMIEALGKNYHPDCFRCPACSNLLQGSFALHDNKPHCVECVKKIVNSSSSQQSSNNNNNNNNGNNNNTQSSGPAKTCEWCKDTISQGKILSLDDKFFHPQCFMCYQCFTPLTGKVAKRDQKYYCDKCIKNVMDQEEQERKFQEELNKSMQSDQRDDSPQYYCSICNGLTKEKVITVGANYYHEHCFKCHKCNRLLNPSEEVSLVAGNRLCCVSCGENVAQEIAGVPTCSECNRKITQGQVANLEGKSYHSDCLLCFGCKKRMADIAGGQLAFVNGKVHCVPCAEKKNPRLKCEHCKDVIQSEYMTFQGKAYCPPCASFLQAQS